MILRLTARELSAEYNAAFGRQSNSGVRAAPKAFEVGRDRDKTEQNFVMGSQSSSGVEQRTHKPLVGGSIPSSGTNLFTA